MVTKETTQTRWSETHGEAKSAACRATATAGRRRSRAGGSGGRGERERESQQRAGTPQAWYSDPEGLKSVAEGGTSSPRDGLPVMADHSGSGGGGGCGRRRNGVSAERKAAWSSCPARRICIAGYFYHVMTSLVPCGSCLSLRPPRGRKGEQQSGRASDHAVEHVAVTSRPVCVSVCLGAGWLAHPRSQRTLILTQPGLVD